MPLTTSSFAIVHGLSIADPPLSRAVGIACADGLTQIYFAKGTPLPARRTFVHHTVKAVTAADADDLLAVPVVQGESTRSHRNRLIGVLRIAGVKANLAAGARVEVTLQLDRSGQLHARADVPALGQTFAEVAHVMVPTATLATAGRELEALNHRVGELQRRTFLAAAPAAAQALAPAADLLAEAEACLGRGRGGDLDAAHKVHRLLLDLGAALDDAEAILAWPELERETRSAVVSYAPLVAAWGTAAEQQLFEQTLQAVSAAERRRDTGELERQLEALRALARAAHCRNPQSLREELEWAAANVTEALDVARAHELVARARAAAETSTPGGTHALRAVGELWQLFPSSPEQQRESESGVSDDPSGPGGRARESAPPAPREPVPGAGVASRRRHGRRRAAGEDVAGDARRRSARGGGLRDAPRAAGAHAGAGARRAGRSCANPERRLGHQFWGARMARMARVGRQLGVTAARRAAGAALRVLACAVLYAVLAHALAMALGIWAAGTLSLGTTLLLALICPIWMFICLPSWLAWRVLHPLGRRLSFLVRGCCWLSPLARARDLRGIAVFVDVDAGQSLPLAADPPADAWTALAAVREAERLGEGGGAGPADRRRARPAPQGRALPLAGARHGVERLVAVALRRGDADAATRYARLGAGPLSTLLVALNGDEGDLCRRRGVRGRVWLLWAAAPCPRSPGRWSGRACAVRASPP